MHGAMWLQSMLTCDLAHVHHITIDIAFEQSAAVFGDHVQLQTANGRKSNTAPRNDASHDDEELSLKRH